MHFVLVNRFFFPDESATSLLLTDLAADLAAAGHRVTVICSRMSCDDPRRRFRDRERLENGVLVHRLPTTRLGRGTFLSRLFDVFSFHAALRFLDSLETPPDAWFAMTDPPYLLHSVLLLRKRFGGRVIHHVDDLYPDLAFALGALPDLALLRRCLEVPAVCALKSSDRVVALGHCMKRRLAEKGVAANRIHVVPPWADGRALSPVPPAANSWRRRFVGNGTDFVVMYSGNMGRAHPFSSMVEAARYFSRRRGIRFLFVGGGARRGAVEAICGAGTGVTLLPYQPRWMLPESLSAGDLHLISLDPAVQGMIVPSKLAGILAVGRPVIFLGGRKNSVAEAVTAGGFGYVVAETDHEGLKAAILRLHRDPALHRRMCENARHFFLRNYERAYLTEKVTAILENRWGCR